ncbi:MAG: enoyl-CoA hydratase-related protein [Dongiaceae bacterium]
MTFSSIRLERDGAVARLTLDRPDRLNALTRAMLGEIRDALGAVAGDGTSRVLVLTGAGRGFCAGQDLRDAAAVVDADAVAAVIRDGYNPVIRALVALPMPVIAMVNGIASGAGCSLALAADLVLAAESASFGFAFTRIGLVPDAGCTHLLPRRVGWARALGLALTGEPLAATAAVASGLIWKCVPDDRLADETARLAAQLAALPARALALTKQAMRASAGNDLQAQLELEEKFQREAADSNDFREGVAAFLEKRPARFNQS